MGLVVSFDGYTPPARFDSLAWTDVQIEEALTPGGSWAVIDTLTFAVPDADPANPQPRSFTTENGTAPNRWYRLTFIDGNGDISNPSAPVQKNTAGAGTGQPCQSWIDADDVADCCDVTIGSDNTEDLETAAETASGILYQLTGRRYPGSCEKIVRPDAQESCWSREQIQGRWQRLSRIRLAGHATAIEQVLIDGAIVDPTLYRLDEHRWLTRMADPDGRSRSWPRWQRLDLPATEPDTFQITYLYGADPPPGAVAAASALACELYRACPGTQAAGECNLPAGVKRIVRQGVTVEMVASIAAMLRKGATGIVAVDAFLSVYGRATRASAIWSPDVDPMPRPEGVSGGS